MTDIINLDDTEFNKYRKHSESHLYLVQQKKTFCQKEPTGDCFQPQFIEDNKLPKSIITCQTCVNLMRLSMKLGASIQPPMPHLESWFI